MILKQSDKTCHCLPNEPFLAFLLKPCVLSRKRQSLTQVHRETSSHFFILPFSFLTVVSCIYYLSNCVKNEIHGKTATENKLHHSVREIKILADNFLIE